MRIPDTLVSIVDVLFPRTCHICGNPLSRDVKFICEACRAGFPRTNYHRSADNAMERRFMGRFPFERAAGHFFYSSGSDLSNLIQDVKYRRFPGIARELGRLIGDELAVTPFLSGIEIILPVPLHWRKLASRGYNQSLHFAKGLAESASLSVGDNLYARRNHRTQTALTLEQRRLNTSGIFAIRRPDDLKGKGILLVDDVCTTGATLSSAAEVITTYAQDIRLSILTIGVTF
ncbi:MAG: ComF family protein [Muribaculaceae bacterium]|nr:ComF family protein [Muribaculaceae bacterium]